MVDRSASAPLSRAKLRALFTGLLLAMTLGALDSTIVATALPTIVDDLGQVERLSWVVTSYLLGQTVVIPLYGRLGDLYGRRVVLQSAIAVFVLGSALCGLSTSMAALIAFRVLQGLGGGGLIVSSQAAIADMVAPRDRTRYQGILGAAFAVAGLAGPVLGGFFATYLSWRWIFYINLPLGALAFAMVRAHLPAAPGRNAGRALDYKGALALSVALAAIVLATDLGGRPLAWSSGTVPALAGVAAAALIAFVAIERRVREPLLPLHLFRERTFTLTALIGFSVGFALFGALTYLPMFLELVKGASPTQSGLELTPMLMGAAITSTGAGQMISRNGRYRVFPIAGVGVATAALVWLSTITPAIAMIDLAVRLFVLGAGLGMVTQVLVIAVQNTIRYEHLGIATSGATMFRFIGGSVGTAVLGSLFVAHAGDLNGLTAERLAALPEAARAEYSAAITAALALSFRIAGMVALVAFALTWLIPACDSPSARTAVREPTLRRLRPLRPDAPPQPLPD
jgi:EmrB/QacA subfamily drug resistance transporter